jgi:hypothetical protein
LKESLIEELDISQEQEVDPVEEEKKRLKKLKNQISSEIRTLQSQLKFPSELRLGVAGTALGFAVGSYPGALLGSISGFLLGKRRQLTDDEKQLIQNLIRQKEQQLAQIDKGISNVNNQAEGVLSAADLMQMDYQAFDFDGDWLELFGQPAKPFHAMVFGRPKAGKSIFCFQFADYLTEFGPVLYIASEEGFKGTIRDKVKNFTNNSNFNISDARGMDQMREFIPGHDFVFIDSVNYAHLEVEDVEQLKVENPETSFITIQQATKGGQFRGSQEYAHNCDIVVEVIDGVAYQKGRFQAASEYHIFDQPEEKKGSEPKKEENIQLEITDL